MAARRGKIARLPWEVRKTVCAMIADGRPAREVCEFVNSGDALSSQGIAPLTEQNVSEWRAGGQKEWEANQASAARLARLNEASLHLVEASGGDPSAVGSRILAGRLAEMLESLGDGDAVPLARALSSLWASFVCFLFSILLFPFQIVDVSHILDNPTGIMQKCEVFFVSRAPLSPFPHLTGAATKGIIYAYIPTLPRAY